MDTAALREQFAAVLDAFVRPGRRLTATAPKVFGHVFDPLGSWGPLTGTSARSATQLSGCVGIVGWVDDERVLCRDHDTVFLEWW